MAHHKLFIAWLNDAYASEIGIVQALESQVDAAADFPEVQSGIQRHLEATRGHAETVKGCLESLGESPSGVKTGLAAVGGKVQGLMPSMAEDTLVKAALQDYSTEHMEIASYKALIVAAGELGHPEIAEKCQTILRDEEAMAAWLDQQLPMVVRATLSKAQA